MRHPVYSSTLADVLRTASILSSALVFFGGCTAAKTLFHSKIALNEVNFEVSRKANDSTPFSVELIALSDETLLPALLAMSADQWFDPEANFKRDHPTAVQTWYYELTPGLHLQVRDAPFKQRSTRAVLLFANYKGKGAYRMRLDTYRRATVQFSEKTIELAERP